MPTHFDTYLFVDWSSSNQPSPARPRPDTIWSAEMRAGGDWPETQYHRTRHAAFQHLLDRLKAAVAERARVLVGFDFPYGYPCGFADAVGADGPHPPWLAIWRHIAVLLEDSESNRSNRFAVAARINATVGKRNPGPFWGCPGAQASRTLATRSPAFPYFAGHHGVLARTRWCEQALPGTQETWKLYGAGSVGSQALTGIPRLHALRFHPALRDCSLVWPFETGFTSVAVATSGPLIVHAEIWPGVVREHAEQLQAERPWMIRDEAQVAALCLWCERLDAQGELGSRLDTPDSLDADQAAICLTEEGWVLGA